MNLPVGTLLRGGTYRIVRFIDSGGFGRTYEAEHLMLQKRVAIKEFFVKDFCTRNENTSYVVVGIKSKEPLVDKLKSKFVDEARAVSRFRHAGIVQVSDVFEENGTAYYVMDYIEGSSLKDIVRSEGPLSERRALKYIFQVADALKYVHEHNRLHLDVKPGNIMVDGSDNAILIDFGTSKQYDEVSGENTSTLLGHTPGYAPPEQMSKSVMNFLPATDIYALGAALYNLLTGKTPPDANDRISGTMLDPLPASVSDCVRRAVEESMRLNKSQRPQCIEEFLAILRGGEQAKSETKQARPSGTSRPADDSTVWYENNNVGGASNERRSDKGDRSGGGNDKVAKGGVSDKPSSSPNRAKRWIIVACVIVGLIAGFFLLKSLMSGGGADDGQVAALQREQYVKDSLEDVQRSQHIKDSIAAAERAEQEEAAREEAARQEAARQEAARQEAARQEAARQEAERQEAARQEAARQEAERQEAERQEAALPYMQAEVGPSFQGGDANDFSKWVQQRLVYPEIALEKGISGTVILYFEIDEDGNLINVKVLKGVDKSLDDEAVRVVKSSPKWTPGRQYHIPVKCQYQFPVTFQLK